MAEVAAITALVFSAVDVVFLPFALVRLYGASGIVYYVFGSRTTWRTEAHVLGALQDEDAHNFKKSVQEECAMISVAAAIVAQVAITGLGFAELSKTHWVARALFLYSVIASLMAVYYATTQQRVMGRLHQPEQIRGWVRGRLPLSQQQQAQQRHGGGIRIQGVPLYVLADQLYGSDIRIQGDPPYVLADQLRGSGAGAQGEPYPNETASAGGSLAELEFAQRYFLPSVTSVLTVSAPQMLLFSSLLALLLGVSVYFGFVWTRGLDGDAGKGDSRSVMIVYLVSIVACFGVYSVSQFLQEDERRPEDYIVREYVQDSFGRRNGDDIFPPSPDLQHSIRLHLYSIQRLLRDIREISQTAVGQQRNEANEANEATNINPAAQAD